MIKLVQAFCVVCILAFTFSCEKCETCSVESISSQDGVETVTSSSEGVEYCGDAIDTVKDTAIDNIDADGNGLAVRVSCN